MDERVKQYEAKMQKAYDFLLSDYVIATDDTSMNLLVQLMHDRTQEEKTLAINLLKVLFANK